ncbi:MAG: thiE [Bacilli bacterium]|nr:thiE [Bacilli bacterium]
MVEEDRSAYSHCFRILTRLYCDLLSCIASPAKTPYPSAGRDAGLVLRAANSSRAEEWMTLVKLDLSLYLVAGPSFVKGHPFLEAVEKAIVGGVTCVQFREKEGRLREWLACCYELRALTKRLGIPFLVNDRLDLALAVDADGVHLGQSDLPYIEARRILGREKWIGISAHTQREAVEAQSSGADYIGVGPMAQTNTKLDTEPVLGPAGLQEIRKHVSLPIVAIGGIDAGNTEEVIRAGASGIAVVSSILGATDPQQAARTLAELIQSSRPNHLGVE